MGSLRILYLGDFRVEWNTACYVARALSRAGCTVYRMEERETDYRRIVRRLKRLKPDLFLFAKARVGGRPWESSRSATVSLIRATRKLYKVSASWVFDLLAPDFNIGRWRWAKAVSQCCDLFFTTDGYSANLLTKFCNPIVLRQGVPDDVRPGIASPHLQFDACFLGSVYGARERDVGILRHFGHRFAEINNVRGASLSDLMASVGVVVGPVYPYRPNYWSNRLYVVTGHGGLFVGPEVPGMADEGWVAGTHYIRSHSAGPGDTLKPTRQILGLVSDAVADPIRCERIRRTAQAFALAKHTYDHRVSDLLEHVQKLL